MLSGCQSILDCHSVQFNLFTTHEQDLCFYNMVALSEFIIQEYFHQAWLPPALEPPGHSPQSLSLLLLSRSYSNRNGHSRYSFLVGSLIMRADLVVSNLLQNLLRALVGNLPFLGNNNIPQSCFSLLPLHLFSGGTRTGPHTTQGSLVKDLWDPGVAYLPRIYFVPLGYSILRCPPASYSKRPMYLSWSMTNFPSTVDPFIRHLSTSANISLVYSPAESGQFCCPHEHTYSAPAPLAPSPRAIATA